MPAVRWTLTLLLLAGLVLACSPRRVTASSASQAWIARFGGGVGVSDTPHDLEVDELGNTYVIGESGSSAATVKYDADGNVVWGRLFTPSGGGRSRGLRVGVDHAGNVYAGAEQDVDGKITTHLVKYAADGSPLGSIPYSGFYNYTASLRDLAVDPAGGVYLVGTSSPVSYTPLCFTVKYGADGQIAWQKHYQLSNYGAEGGVVKLDSQGHPVVGIEETSWESGIGFSRDFRFIRYNQADGNVLATGSYNSNRNDPDYLIDLAIDADHNVYVAGQTYNNSVMGWTVVRFASTGDVDWASRKATGGAWGLALSPDNAIYAVGNTGGTNRDFQTIRYRPDGTEEWTRTFDGSASGGDDAVFAACDASGAVYVGGTSAGTGTEADYRIIKYNASGDVRWSADYIGASADQMTGMTLDASLNVCVTGRSVNTPAMDWDWITLQRRQSFDPPIASADAAMTQEDQSVEIVPLANDADVEGFPLSAVQVAAPAHGTLSYAAATRTFIYQPEENYHGSDSFTYRAQSLAGGSTETTVSITVQPVNDPPVVAGQQVALDEDGGRTLTLVVDDPDEDSLTWTVSTGPAHGTLSGSGATRTYTPAADFYGEDEFTFQVNDGTVDSNTGTVEITVNPVNDAPRGQSDSYSLNEDASLNVEAASGVLQNDMDVEGDPFTAVLEQGPAHGELMLNADGSFTYSPDANFAGADGFTYRASDAMAASAPLLVSLQVDPLPDAPLASGQSVSTAEDQAKAIVIAATDADGDTLAYTIVDAPSHGMLSTSGSTRTYTPEANYHGADRFTFRANDGTSDSNLATIAIEVTPVPDSPIAAPQAVMVAEDASVEIALEGTDADGDTLAYTVVDAPTHGTLSGTGASRTYTPAADYHGSDGLTFRVNDGTSDSNLATVSLTVAPVNDGPLAVAQLVTLNEDTPKSFTLEGTDADGDTLTYTFLTGPSHGSLSGSGATRTYTPAGNYHGDDALTFRANDGTAHSNTATVTLRVSPVNDAPTVIGAAATTPEDTTVSIPLPAEDVDGDALTYTIRSGPTHGTLSGSGAARTYTPAADYHGPDNFTFQVRDGELNSGVATITLTITAVTDSPTATGDTYAATEDTPLPVSAPGVLGNDSAGEGSALSAQKLVGPAHGTLTLAADGGFTYTPAENYHGPDSFTYRVKEGAVDGNTVTVSLSVAAVDDAPVALDAAVYAPEDGSISIPLVGSDVEGEALTYALVEMPAHGQLSGEGAARTYTPSANFHGTDTFRFRVIANGAMSSPALVAITVTPANDPPTAVAGDDQTVEATGPTTSVTLHGANSTDLDGDTLSYTWTAGALPLGTGPTPVVALGLGEHTVTLTVADPAGATSTDTVTIRVRDTTAPALQVPSDVTVSQNTPTGALVTFTATGSDAVSAVQVTANPASGTVFPIGMTTVQVIGKDVSGNETTGSFRVTVVVPAVSTGKLAANGTILVGGKKATFALSARQVARRPLTGSLRFTDPIARQTFKSVRVTAFVIEGNVARVFGEARLPNRTIVKFMAQAEDLGTARQVDRFRLELSDGRVYGPSHLNTGTVKITR